MKSIGQLRPGKAAPAVGNMGLYVHGNQFAPAVGSMGLNVHGNQFAPAVGSMGLYAVSYTHLTLPTRRTV